MFDQEARRNNVYPIAPYRLPQPSPAAGRTSFTYREGVTRLPLRAAPDLSGRSHSFTADIEIPANGAEGVIFAEGGRYGGFSLYLEDGKAVYELNTLGKTHEKIVSSEPLPTGKARITVDFVAEGKEGLEGPGAGAEHRTRRRPPVGQRHARRARPTSPGSAASVQRRSTSAAISARRSATTTRRPSRSPAKWKRSRWN